MWQVLSHALRHRPDRYVSSESPKTSLNIQTNCHNHPRLQCGKAGWRHPVFHDLVKMCQDIDDMFFIGVIDAIAETSGVARGLEGAMLKSRFNRKFRRGRSGELYARLQGGAHQVFLARRVLN